MTSVTLVAAVAGLLVLTACPAAAQAMDAAPADTKDAAQHAVETDMFVSTDADQSNLYRAGVNLDVNYRGPDKYWGFRVEKAWYEPLGQATTDFERVYVRYADTDGHWSSNGQFGTDGHSLLGSATIHNDSRFRQEYFVERDMIETPQGITDGIYYTFAGAAIDVPLDPRNNLTVVAGVQDFTGRNVRMHLRGNYVHVLKEDWGLSVQLRGRYFYSTVPGEFDYYSPRWYAQVLPVVQLRRYSGGWRYMVAGGMGAQRDAGSGWTTTRLLTAEVTSPPIGRIWSVWGGAQYGNTPLAIGIYDYLQVNVGLRRVF